MKGISAIDHRLSMFSENFWAMIGSLTRTHMIQAVPKFQKSKQLYHQTENIWTLLSKYNILGKLVNFGISVEGSKGKVKVNKYTESFDIKIQYFNYYSIAGVRQGPDGLGVAYMVVRTQQISMTRIAYLSLSIRRECG